jgi:thiamine biosynthesis lipoprotein
VARRVGEDVTWQVEMACSRFRGDSEIALLPAGGSPARIGPVLAELVQTALLAAARNDGDVDPTLGRALDADGYDRDITLLGGGPLRRLLWLRVAPRRCCGGGGR